jgi:hypothetical protein
MARTRTHFETGVCVICGNVTHYDSRAGRMPKSCEKKSCRSAARKQGRRPKQWKDKVMQGGSVCT